MRWASLALALAASTPAMATPTLGPTNEIWGPTLIDELLAEDGFVVIALIHTECAGCQELEYVARHLDAVEHPGRWHVHVVFAEGYVDDAHELLPGSPLPILALYRRGQLLAARDRAISVEETEAWLAAAAQRTQHIAGGPLACSSRMIDLLIAPGRLDAGDLARHAALRISARTPHGDDPLLTAWGVLASFSVLDPKQHAIELGDVLVDTRDLAARVLVVDSPTRPQQDVANGTLVDDAGAVRGSIELGGIPERGDLIVLRPTAGTFCRG